jgi:hypothetical protein
MLSINTMSFRKEFIRVDIPNMLISVSAIIVKTNTFLAAKT